MSLNSKAGEEEDAAAPAAIIVQEDGTFRHEHLWRGAALALPVFALRSRESVGAGEFQDLKKLVTLCHQAGMAALAALSWPPVRIACRSQRERSHIPRRLQESSTDRSGIPGRSLDLRPRGASGARAQSMCLLQDCA